MNSELVKKALTVVGDPHVLVNIVSRRVRQLTSGAGGACNPMITDVGNLGAADIALREIIEEKLGFEMPELIELTRPTAHNRNRPANWSKTQTQAPVRAKAKHPVPSLTIAA